MADAKAAFVAASTQLPMRAGLLEEEAVAFVSLKPQTDFAGGWRFANNPSTKRAPWFLRRRQ